MYFNCSVQLEETEDFDARREIRQKLRELRKKRLAALETDTSASSDRDKRRAERRRQREKDNKETTHTVERKTQEKTVEIVPDEGADDNAAVSSFQLSVSTTRSRVVENGMANGCAEEEAPIETDGQKETVEVKGSENGTHPGDSALTQEMQASEERHVAKEEPVEGKTELLVKEQPNDEKTHEEVTKNGGEQAGQCEEETKEAKSSLAVIEEIEDLDNLEKLVSAFTDVM